MPGRYVSTPLSLCHRQARIFFSSGDKTYDPISRLHQVTIQLLTRHDGSGTIGEPNGMEAEVAESPMVLTPKTSSTRVCALVALRFFLRKQRVSPPVCAFGFLRSVACGWRSRSTFRGGKVSGQSGASLPLCCQLLFGGAERSGQLSAPSIGHEPRSMTSPTASATLSLLMAT